MNRASAEGISGYLKPEEGDAARLLTVSSAEGISGYLNPEEGDAARFLTVYVGVQSAASVLTVSEKSDGLAEPLNKSATGSAPAISAAGSAEPLQSGVQLVSKTARKSSASPRDLMRG